MIRAFKKQAKNWPPDRNPNNSEEATRRVKEALEACQVLVVDKGEKAKKQLMQRAQQTKNQTKISCVLHVNRSSLSGKIFVPTINFRRGRPKIIRISYIRPRLFWF